MPTLKEERMAAALDAPGVVEMQVGNAKKPLDEMTPKDIASWLDGQGLGHLGQSFIRHKINGKYLVALTKTDLEKMGIETLGDQYAVMEELTELKRAARRVLRDQILWRGKEKLFDNCCIECFQTCCFICPIPPARYTLTNQSLKITEVDIFRCCGSVRCACCGIKTNQNTIDLNYIKDVDFNIDQSCCENTANIHVVQDLGGDDSKTITMKVPGGEAPEACTLIKNAIEDAKMRRERGARDFM